MHVESDPLLMPDHLYKCRQCEMKFKRKGGMKRHVLHVHEGKKYNCKMCPLEFGWKHKLKEHILHVVRIVIKAKWRYSKLKNQKLNLKDMDLGISLPAYLARWKQKYLATLS